MRAQPINIDNLVTIVDHLEALVVVEDTITTIDNQLNAHTDGVHGWRKRAEMALRSWQSTKRRITARLAVLRQEEKVRNLAIHQQDNDFLIEEMKRYLPRSAFLACAHRAKLKAESSHGE